MIEHVRKRPSQRLTSSFSKPVRRQPALHCSQCSPPRASSQWKTMSPTWLHAKQHVALVHHNPIAREPLMLSHDIETRRRRHSVRQHVLAVHRCPGHSISSLIVAGECGGRERTHCEWEETSMSAYFVGFIRTLTQDHVHGVCSYGVRLFDHF